MSRDNIDDIFGLSPMQQLMLMHSLTAAGAMALANQFLYRLTGEVEVERFRGAWQTLVDRHAALRTAFLWEDLRAPVQVVRARTELRFEYVDLSGFDAASRAQRLAELRQADRRRNFDLRKAPLMRLTLVRIDGATFCLVWNRHHLIMDRWCVDLLFDELFSLYDGGPGAASLAAPGTFRDYIGWIGQQDAARAEHYWRGALQGMHAPTLLCGARAGRTRWSPEGVPTVERVLAEGLAESLRGLARETRVTLAAVAQTAIGLFVARQAGTRDVMFGLSVAGRPPGLRAVEATVGSFMNNVPVRLRLDGGARGVDLLQSVHAAQSGRFAFEHVSPADIHRWSGLPGGTPLFDVLSLLHSPLAQARRGPGFDIEQLASPVDSAYPLTLSVTEKLGRLCLAGAYDPNGVARQQASDLLAALERILTALVDAPARPVGEFLPQDTSATAAAPAAPPRAPRSGAARAPATDGAAAVLSAIWSDTLGVARVGLDEDFFALGGTSIQAALAFAAMERELGTVLPLSTLFKAGSIREILALLEQPLPPASPLVEIQALGTRPPLFVVPGIGGNVVGLAALARALGAEQPFYGLQSPGLDGAAEPIKRIEDIAEQFVAAMGGHTAQPFVLCGVCWGAMVAFDMARQFAARGAAPALLVMLDPTYQTASAAPLLGDSKTTALLRFGRHRLKLYWSEFRALDGAARRAWLRAKKDLVVSMIRERDPFRGNRTELNQQRVAAANLEALRRYRPQPYDGPSVILLTADRPVGGNADPRLHWQRLVPADAPLGYVPGTDTGDALSGVNVATVADILCGHVAATLGSSEDHG